MALILSIETGTDICSVALSREGRLIALRESEQGQDHARKLAVYIDEILKANDQCAEDLDAVSVGKGPGSYTGLRIGVSLAKGICYGQGIPLIAVNSLLSLAHVCAEDRQAGIISVDNWDESLLCPMIDARRMEVYSCLFDTSLRPVAPTEATVVDENSYSDFTAGGRKIFFFGNGASKCRDVLPAGSFSFLDVVPSARGLIAPSYDMFRKGKFEDTAYFEPFYLKDFIVTRYPKRNFSDHP